MAKGKYAALPDNYRAAVTLIILLLISFCGYAQTYNPSAHVVVNDAVGPAQATPIDSRSMFYDGTNFLYRPYQNTSEVLSYLNLAKYRTGNFIITVDSGGTLQFNGTYLNGHNTFYMFADSTGNANLVKLNLFGTGGVTSFGPTGNVRSGAVVPATGDYTFAQIGSTPTTIAGYGITDAVSVSGVQTLTNKTMSGASNTFTNIPNSALVNNSIGLTLNSTGSSPTVTTSPAALGASLVLSVPNGSGSNDGFILHGDWTNFHLKVDSTTESNDTVYDWHNGSATFRYVIPAGTGAVLSVTNVDGTMTFSPTTGNVVGSVNQGANFTWTGTNTFTGAPTFSSLTTNGGVFYGNGSGTLQQSPVGTSGQIFESQGASGPIFFTPNLATVTGWLGYTPLSSALGSTHIFVGNGSNIATDVAATGDWTLSNTGVNTIGNNKITYAKIQAAAGQGLMGATGAGNFGLITLGTNLSLSGTTLNATGGGSLSLTTTASVGASNAPTLVSTTLNIDTLSYVKIFTPEQFGGKADGKRILDASTQSGVNTLTSTSANFTIADTGKYVRVSGTGGVDLFARIIGLTSSTVVTLSANATSTASGEMAIYGTDNTPAVQQCIFADSVNGGGRIHFRNGVYVFAGPLNTTAYGVNPNSQLYFPISGLGFGRTPFLTRTHYVFEGETPPNFAPLFFTDSLPSLKATVLYDIIDGSGELPALFGTKTPTGTINNISYNYFTFKDLTILVPQNIGNGGPSIGGINMYYAAGAITDNVLVCTDQSISVSVQPIHEVAGIVYPQAGAEIQNSGKLTQVECFKYGIIAFDDFLGDNIFVMACSHGLVLPQNAENVQINSYKSYWNQNNVYFPNSAIGYIPAGIAYFNINNMMSEVVTSVGPWYAYTDVIQDTSDLARGNINYTMVASGGSFNNGLYNQFNGDSIQAYAIGAPSLHPGIAQVLASGNTDVTLGPSGPNMTIGNTNWQSLSTTNFALAQNMSFNGSVWTRGVTGAASSIQLFQGSVIGRFAVSGTGGASVLNSFSFNPDGSGGIGGTTGVVASSTGYWLNWNTTGQFLMPGTLDIGGSSAGPGPKFTLDGNVSSSTGSTTIGSLLNITRGNTFTEGGSGTIAVGGTAYIGEQTWAAGSATTYTNAATLLVNAAPTAGTNVTFTNKWSLYVASGNSLFNGNIQSNIGGFSTFTHYLGNNQSSNNPTIAAGAGAGSSPTISIQGGDQDGLITITTGTLPTGSATVATITYGYAFPNNSYVVLYPANAVTAALGTLMVYTTGSTTNFTLTSPTAGLGAATTYSWSYHAGGN